MAASGKACGQLALTHPRPTVALFMNMKPVPSWRQYFANRWLAILSAKKPRQERRRERFEESAAQGKLALR